MGTFWDIMDEMVTILKERRLNEETIVEFKQLLVEMEQKYGQALCRETLLREYFPNATRQEYQCLMMKLKNIEKRAGLKAQSVNRYFREMTIDKSTGERFWTARKEILTYLTVKTELKGGDEHGS